MKHFNWTPQAATSFSPTLGSKGACCTYQPGDVSLGGDFEKLDFSSNSGDLLCRDVTVKQLISQTTSGDMQPPAVSPAFRPPAHRAILSADQPDDYGSGDPVYFR